MAKPDDIIIKLVEGHREIEEVRKLALTTGAEEHEINEMIKGDRVYVMQKHRSMVGFLALGVLDEKNVVEITGLAVKETERRKGLASILLRHGVEAASSMNARRVCARTSNDNIPSLALYQKNGFRITEIGIGAMIEHHGGELRGWEDIPVRDEITLEKPLPRK